MERVPLCSLRSASARSPLPAMSLAFGAGGRSRRGSTSSSASAMLREQDERDGGPPSPRPEYLLGAIEIGRAECRERVCQSVEIQVVDASLKKKKEKHQEE